MSAPSPFGTSPNGAGGCANAALFPTFSFDKLQTSEEDVRAQMGGDLELCSTLKIVRPQELITPWTNLRASMTWCN
jgi:hypothetical protein